MVSGAVTLGLELGTEQVAAASVDAETGALRRAASRVDGSLGSSVRAALEHLGVEGGLVTRVAVSMGAMEPSRPIRVALLLTEGGTQEVGPEVQGLAVLEPVIVRERTGMDGSIGLPLEPEVVAAALEAVYQCHADAVAVCLTHGAVNPAHEQMMCLAIQDLTPFVSASWQLGRVAQEAERFRETIRNAAMLPATNRLLDELTDTLGELGIWAPLTVAAGTGAVITSGAARQLPVLTLDGGEAVTTRFKERLGGNDPRRRERIRALDAKIMRLVSLLGADLGLEIVQPIGKQLAALALGEMAARLESLRNAIARPLFVEGIDPSTMHLEAELRWRPRRGPVDVITMPNVSWPETLPLLLAKLEHTATSPNDALLLSLRLRGVVPNTQSFQGSFA